MSTRSGIAVVNADKTVEAVYCHYDGYPEYNGKLLTTYYNDEDSARKIVSLGSLSSLGVRLDPIGKHSFDNPERDTTIAYARDRHESFSVEEYESVSDYRKLAFDDYCAEYLYWFENGEWYCVDYNNNIISLY